MLHFGFWLFKLDTWLNVMAAVCRATNCILYYRYCIWQLCASPLNWKEFSRPVIRQPVIRQTPGQMKNLFNISTSRTIATVTTSVITKSLDSQWKGACIWRSSIIMALLEYFLRSSISSLSWIFPFSHLPTVQEEVNLKA